MDHIFDESIQINYFKLVSKLLLITVSISFAMFLEVLYFIIDKTISVCIFVITFCLQFLRELCNETINLNIGNIISKESLNDDLNDQKHEKRIQFDTDVASSSLVHRLADKNKEVIW